VQHEDKIPAVAEPLNGFCLVLTTWNGGQILTLEAVIPSMKVFEKMRNKLEDCVKVALGT
jgi:hypothetical protein